MLKDNPMMKKLVAKGEQGVSRLVSQLMGNEKFVAGVQSIVAKAFTAKGVVDKSLRAALSTMNLPSTADIASLNDKLSEVEKLLASLETKIDSRSK
jgi:hypothetical protein